MTLKQRIEIKRRLKEKGEETNIKPPDDANKRLDKLVDDTIKDVRNLKEDEEIYPEIKKPIENEIPQEVKKEFDHLAKSLEHKKTMTEKENILYEVRELRNDIDTLNRRITKRQTEDMDIMKMIFDRLRFLKGITIEINGKHKKVWLGFITLGVLVGIAIGMLDDVWMRHLGSMLEAAKALYFTFKG